MRHCIMSIMSTRPSAWRCYAKGVTMIMVVVTCQGCRTTPTVPGTPALVQVQSTDPYTSPAILSQEQCCSNVAQCLPLLGKTLESAACGVAPWIPDNHTTSVLEQVIGRGAYLGCAVVATTNCLLIVEAEDPRDEFVYVFGAVEMQANEARLLCLAITSSQVSGRQRIQLLMSNGDGLRVYRTADLRGFRENDYVSSIGSGVHGVPPLAMWMDPGYRIPVWVHSLAGMEASGIAEWHVLRGRMGLSVTPVGSELLHLPLGEWPRPVLAMRLTCLELHDGEARVAVRPTAPPNRLR